MRFVAQSGAGKWRSTKLNTASKPGGGSEGGEGQVACKKASYTKTLIRRKNTGKKGEKNGAVLGNSEI